MAAGKNNPIKVLRKEIGTQNGIADKAGINPSHLRKIENNKVKRPRTETLRKIAEALGIDEEILRQSYYPENGLPTEFGFMDKISPETQKVNQPRTVEGMLICKLLLSGKVHAKTEKALFKHLQKKKYFDQ